MIKRRLFSRKTSPWVVVAVIAFIVAGQFFGWFSNPQQSAAPIAKEGPFQVVRFVDGDTIVVNTGDKHESVRMIGVDTPETHAPNTPVQCYGAAAAAYTKNLIGDQPVRLESDPSNDNRDRYGRLLRYVYLPKGELVAREIISNGYGFAYTAFPFTKKSDFVASEKQARNAGKGLWGNCTVTEENGRKQTNPAAG